MLRRGLLLGVLAGLATGATAHAEVPPAAFIARAEAAAFNYWHGDPPCGAPHITLGVVTVENPTAPGVRGEAAANAQTCTIEFSTANVWSRYEWVCTAMTHEWGHLSLGLGYFQATNPGDPSHSPESGNVMSAGGPAYPFRPCAERATRRRHRHSRNHKRP